MKSAAFKPLSNSDTQQVTDKKVALAVYQGVKNQGHAKAPVAQILG
jgi:hypothetical protein